MSRPPPWTRSRLRRWKNWRWTSKRITPSSSLPTICSRRPVFRTKRLSSCWASWLRWARPNRSSRPRWTNAPKIISRAVSADALPNRRAARRPLHAFASAKTQNKLGGFYMPTSNRKVYDEELLQLDSMLARMGHAAGGAIESAMTALKNGDLELARSVVARDSEINAVEHDVEHRCLTLILRQQPVASDLLKVSTALKMVTDIERIADQASDIAEIVLHLDQNVVKTFDVMADIYRMGDLVLGMVKQAIGAYVQVDMAAAAEVIARDDQADAFFSRISAEIAHYIAAHPAEAETALDLFMVSKYLEGLGDHAVNVAEWVEFLKTGVHKSRKIV